MECFKVCTLGEGRVGKTSIVRKYLFKNFSEEEQSTLKAVQTTAKVNVQGTNVKLSIWDTAGQERFHGLGPIYYRDAHGVLLVYDITDMDSFERATAWAREVRQTVEGVGIVVAGNKIDCAKNQKVSEEVAMGFCNQIGASHIYTSAKTGENLEECFGKLAEVVLAARVEERAKQKGRPKLSGSDLVEDDDERIESAPSKPIKILPTPNQTPKIAKKKKRFC